MIFSQKGCGLFSLLPEPKNVTKSISAALVPQSISRVKTKTHLKKSSSVATKQKKAPEIVATDAPDDDDVDPVSSFFFTEHDDSAPLPDLPPITSLVDVHDNNQLTQVINIVKCNLDIFNYMLLLLQRLLFLIFLTNMVEG